MTQNPGWPYNTVAEWGFTQSRKPDRVPPQRVSTNVLSIFNPQAAQEAYVTEIDDISIRTGDELDLITDAFSRMQTRQLEVVTGRADLPASMARIASLRHSVIVEDPMSNEDTARPPSSYRRSSDDGMEEERFSLVAETLVEQFPDIDLSSTMVQEREGSGMGDAYSDMSIGD